MVLLRLVALLLAVTCATGEASAKINSIKTVLPEPHATAAGRSRAGSPQVYPCSSDLACGERSFCHAPSRNPAPKSCHACRRRAKPCRRDAMCCPGNHCSNNVCTPLYDRGASHRIPAVEENHRKKVGWRTKTHTKLPTIKGHTGDPCLRTSDCSEGHCCARHFWGRICKLVLKQGEVCTRHRRKEHLRLELFQRCDCGEGLACKSHLPVQRSPRSLSSTPSSTLSSTPSPRAHLASTVAVAARGRLHLCQGK
ncbi:dickkopf-related protein 2 [Esox lucius]|uniref:dickkopf-related protein 2 n=1 Tax=Esox lucius TaxID=8010 RepID=UPI0014770C68|nr:dickkopf-related protein 2 [Esox lucius]